MVSDSCLGRYATAATLVLAALFHPGLATAQTPGMTLISFGGTAQETLAGFVIDRAGNYYIAGTTASLDLPVNVLQQHPGGAVLYRFRAGHADPLYPSPAAISAIASDPSHPGYLYAYFNRAVWKSPDSGNTWQRLDADWPATTDCTGITVAPKDGRTIYVLCPGGVYPQYSPQYLFRSTDAASTWVRARIDEGQPWNVAQLRNLAVDPFNPQSVWAGGEFFEELFDPFVALHSTDGGDTWVQTTPSLFHFAFDLQHPGIAYAFAYDGFYRTADAGQTWTKLPIPPQASQFAYGATIAVLPSGDPLLLISLAASSLLVRSSDNGLTWQTYSLPGAGAPCQSLYGGLESALAADPLSGSIYLQMCGRPQSVIYRSDDAGATWLRLNAVGLPDLKGQTISGSDYFAIVRQSSDAFVAKLSPSGNMIWSTYLGGVHDETATGLALDPSGNVYVIGTTLSDDFTTTAAPLAKALPGGSTNPKSFLAKLSPDGTQLLYSVLYAYDATTRGIVTDPSGAVYITGNAGPLLPTTPGVIRPNAVGNGPNPFVLKLDPSGPRVMYGTYLAEDQIVATSPVGFPTPIVANAIAVDSDGNAYVGGTYIWKLNADATGFVFSTRLAGGTVNAVAVDAGRNLFVGGSASTLTFSPTPGAFQTQVLPTACNFGGACWATPAFVTKFNADASQMLYSTYLGGDGSDFASSLAIASDGTVYAAGNTSSRSFPTRTPIWGSGQSGFVSALVPDGSDVALSTYVGNGGALEVVAVALDPAGNLIVAGDNFNGPFGAASFLVCSRCGPGPTYTPPASDVLIFRLDYSHTGSSIRPRLDAILNAASRTGTPLAAGQRVALEGAGFQADSQVCFDDTCVTPITAAAGEILAAPPASIPNSGSVAVSVRSSDGSRSNQVLMPAGPAQLAFYSADNTGTGNVLALNEDGTLNSPPNPARRGTVVTIPANGLDPSAQIHLGSGWISSISVSPGAFPAIAGEVPLIHAMIDPNAHFSPFYPNLPLMGSVTPGHLPVTLSVDTSQPAP